MGKALPPLYFPLEQSREGQYGNVRRRKGNCPKRKKKTLTYPLNLSRLRSLPLRVLCANPGQPNLLHQIPLPLSRPSCPDPQFGLTPEIVKRPFAEIGDIRTFFDLVEKRAMAFVTYVRRLSPSLCFERNRSAW